ncbi:MAG: site-specific integrase, partial [Spirochaetota bacterium]
MNSLIRFVDHLYLEKGLSLNTVSSYKSDLSLFLSYLESEGIDFSGVNEKVILEYLSFCHRSGLQHRTISRYLSSLRALFRFLMDENLIDKDPTVNVARPRSVNNPPEYLTLEEVEKL